MNQNHEPTYLNLVSNHDRLFDSNRYPLPFAFNEEVAGVFDDMVRRSIPLYLDVHRYLGDWCRRFHQADGAITDIGCSTGTTIHFLAQCLSQRARFIGIDSSQAMIRKAEAKLADLPARHQLTLLCQNIEEASLTESDVIIMNYTLQFIPVASRPGILRKLFQALKPGGILFMSEKVRAEDPILQETATFIYEKFKLEQGYSKTEIARKKEALDQVLVPFTEKEHRQHLSDVGFSAVETVIKWNNFTSFVAMKGLH